MKNDPSCVFRSSVLCSRYNRQCDGCGWNPVVEDKRISAMLNGTARPFLRINMKEYINGLSRFQDQLQADRRKEAKDG